MDAPDFERQVEHLARQITGLVLAREGHLIAVHLTRPADLAAPALKGMLRERLAESGIDFVDIHLRDEAGPVRLLSATIEPSRQGDRPDHVTSSPELP